MEGEQKRHNMKTLVFTIGIVFQTFYTSSYASGSAFTFELPDKEEVCMYQDFEGSGRQVLEYMVLRGGNNDVDCNVISPNNKVMYQGKKKSKDKVIFETSNGAFRICFSNKFSTFTHKVVYFDLRPEELDSLANEAGNDRPTAGTIMDTLCDSVHEFMTTVVDFQRDYRLKETIGRHLGENLNIRVTWWSAIQSVVILIAGFGQVFVLRTFFTDKHKTTTEA